MLLLPSNIVAQMCENPQDELSENSWVFSELLLQRLVVLLNELVLVVYQGNPFVEPLVLFVYFIELRS